MMPFNCTALLRVTKPPFVFFFPSFFFTRVLLDLICVSYLIWVSKKIVRTKMYTCFAYFHQFVFRFDVICYCLIHYFSCVLGFSIRSLFIFVFLDSSVLVWLFLLTLLYLDIYTQKIKIKIDVELHSFLNPILKSKSQKIFFAKTQDCEGSTVKSFVCYPQAGEEECANAS